MDELTKHFKPELINRFDEVVVFEPLTAENMLYITNLGIEGTRKMLKEQNIGLQVSQMALQQLAKEGYDPAYGARPLRRLIQRSIENPIAIYLIKKTVGPGDTILIDYNPSKDQYVFSKANSQPGVTPAQPNNPSSPSTTPFPPDQPVTPPPAPNTSTGQTMSMPGNETHLEAS